MPTLIVHQKVFENPENAREFLQRTNLAEKNFNVIEVKPEVFEKLSATNYFQRIHYGHPTVRNTVAVFSQKYMTQADWVEMDWLLTHREDFQQYEIWIGWKRLSRKFPLYRTFLWVVWCHLRSYVRWLSKRGEKT